MTLLVPLSCGSYWTDQPPSEGRTTPLMLTPSSLRRNVIDAASWSAVAIVGIERWNGDSRSEPAADTCAGIGIPVATPPGSACSVVIGTGMGNGPEQGTVKNLHLVVSDIAATREHLVNRGLQITEIHDMGGVKYAYFSDPDGNSWALQEIGQYAKPV